MLVYVITKTMVFSDLEDHEETEVIGVRGSLESAKKFIDNRPLRREGKAFIWHTKKFKESDMPSNSSWPSYEEYILSIERFKVGQ